MTYCRAELTARIGRYASCPVAITVETEYARCIKGQQALQHSAQVAVMNLKISLTPEEKEDLDWAENVRRTIDEKGIDLSSWEIDFISGLDGQIQSGYPLTEKQLDKLAEIFHQRL